MTASARGRTLRVGVGDRLVSAFELRLPPGWVPFGDGTDEEEALFFDAPMRLRVLLRSMPRAGIDIEVANTGESPVLVESPALVLETPGPQLPWLAGATGRVLLPGADGGGVWRQWRGYCSATDDGAGISVLGGSAWVPPGMAIGVGWRLEPSSTGSLPEDPAWLPERCFVPEGEQIVLRAPDSALTAPGLGVQQVGDDTVLTGPAGVHRVTLSDARGTTGFEVGWHPPLEVVAMTAAALTPDAGQAAWLDLGASEFVRRGDLPWLDNLDRLLGASLESPNMWGVLAGFRAAVLTDLPVRAEAEAAAHSLIALQPDSDLGPILIALGEEQLRPRGCVTGPSADWWGVLMRDDDRLRDRVLEWVDHGRITSRPPTHGARGVALASLWLATRERGEGLLQVAQAIERTTSRLLAINAREPDGEELAWLLLAGAFRAER